MHQSLRGQEVNYKEEATFKDNIAEKVPELEITCTQNQEFQRVSGKEIQIKML